MRLPIQKLLVRLQVRFRNSFRLNRHARVNVGKSLIPSLTIGRRVRIGVNRWGITLGATLGLGFSIIQRLIKWSSK